jgi:hypothetical protein
LTEITETTLLNNRKDLFPISIGLFIESNAEEPVALLMSRAKSDSFTSDMEIDEFIFGEVGSETAAGSLVLVVVFEADCVGVLDFEVGEGQTAEGGCREEERGAHFDCDGYIREKKEESRVEVR